MAPLSPKEGFIRILELGLDALLRVGGEGDHIVAYFLEGTERRRVELIIVSNDLLLPGEYETPLPPAPPVDLPEQEARERGLPLYLSREWFMRSLGRERTLEGVARESGYDPAVLREYQERHRLRGDRNDVIRFLWTSGDYRTQTELARALGVSVSVVNSVIGESRDRDLDERIRELLREGLPHEQVVNRLREEGNRKSRDRLLRQVQRVARRREG